MFTSSQPTMDDAPLQDQFLGEMKRFCVGEDCPVFNDMYTFCQARNRNPFLYLSGQEQEGLVHLLPGMLFLPACTRAS